MHEEHVFRQVDSATANLPMAHDLLAGITTLSDLNLLQFNERYRLIVSFVFART